MAATETPIQSVLPYVSWSSLTIAAIPADAWPLVFGSMQALKGHVQEYPGCQKLEAFLERGYTLERLLADFGGMAAERSLVMEKVF